jgi:hypothetical protein
MGGRIELSLRILVGVSLGTMLLGLVLIAIGAWRARRAAPTRRDASVRRAARSQPAGKQTVAEALAKVARRSRRQVEVPAPAEPAEAPAPEPAPAEETPQPAASDRRKHPRIRSDQTFAVTPFAGRETMAQCFDISAGGMRFGIVGCALRAGDLVRVTFNVGAETVGAIGSVLRVKEMDPITTEVSIQFVRIDPWASELLAQALAADA